MLRRFPPQSHPLNSPADQRVAQNAGARHVPPNGYAWLVKHLLQQELEEQRQTKLRPAPGLAEAFTLTKEEGYGKE